MYRFLLFFGVIGLLLACKPATTPTLAPRSSMVSTPTLNGSPIPTPMTNVSPVSTLTSNTNTIPFESLALNDDGVNIKASETSKEPQLLVINDVAQAMALEPMVQPEAFRLLLKVDYENHAVIALFRGWQGSSNYQAMIQQISRHGDRLIVAADLWEPGLGYASTAALTYPYHLIQIARKDLPSTPISLQLEATMITPTPPAKQ